jgi:archaellum component FlaC
LENLQVWLLNPKTLVRGILLVAISVFAVTGCSDDPENEAAKKLRQQTDKALDTARAGDFEKAQKELKSAIKQASVSGAEAEPAMLASGNIAMDHASAIEAKLAEFSEPISALLDQVSLAGREISRMQIEVERAEELLRTSDDQIDQLSKLIIGTTEKPGIEDQLADSYSRLRQLQDQQDELLDQQQEAQDIADSIQAQAEEKLRQADAAQNDEKLHLQQQGYDLLLSRKESLSRVQETDDRITELDGQISVVEPIVEKLQADLNFVQQEIDNIQNSPQRSAMRSQLTGMRGNIENAQSRISALTQALQNAHTEYDKFIEQVDSVLDEAVQNFKKIKSQSVRDIAAMRLAQCHADAGSVAANCMYFHRHLSTRLRSIAAGVEGPSADTLNRFAIECAGRGSDYGKKAMEYYDLSVNTYSELHKRTARGKDEFACDVTKNYILALYGKITLAELLDEYDIVDETAAQAEELMEKAETCDPAFSVSITSRLFTGDLEYTPALAVDNSIYYAQLKKELESWKKLKGAERETEIRSLLNMLAQLPKASDPAEFERIIGPEKQQLETALAKGPAEDTGTSGELYASSSDPNYY